MIQSCWMKLHEFKVCYPRASAERNGQSIARGNIGIGGMFVDLPRTARGQHGDFGAKTFDLPRNAVVGVNPVTGITLSPVLYGMLGDKIDTRNPGKKRNVFFA